jgi:DNA polymerase
MIHQDYYLDLLGIDRWRLRVPPNNADQMVNDWSLLEKAVVNCQACDLHKTRTQPVFGTGNRKANIMFIGEAPGAEEDRQGKPFVGRAGKLLTEMLRAIGLSRDEVYIANILKSRPPGNRDPQAAEVTACMPFLQQQIKFIQPKLLVTLGRIAVQNLLKTTAPLSRLRGQSLSFNQIPLLATYHPAYLLRAPQDKAKAYEDLKKIQTMMEFYQSGDH